MRFILILVVATVAACANGGDGKPDYCKRPFSADDKRFDFDNDGFVSGSDFLVYVENCR